MSKQIITDESEDMKLKLSLEAGLIVAFGKLFRRIASDYRTVYEAVGQVIDAAIYAPEVIGILRPSYGKAGKKTGFEIRKNADLVYPENRRQIESGIDLNLLRFAEREPEERAPIISETTNGQLNDFTFAAIAEAALSGESPTNEQIAKTAAGRFASRIPGRSAVIAISETLNATEGARLIEANGLSDGLVSVKIEDAEASLLSQALYREWLTRQDDHVRPTHQAAHGQRVIGTAEPFRVGDSLLMYPGDTSLGASMNEIMGCRCYQSIGFAV
jgi:hypothetical protein